MNIAPTCGVARRVFRVDVDAGPGEAHRIGVVAALDDDSAYERGQGVPRNVEPIRPCRPVAVVSCDRLADIEHDGLNHLAEPTASSRSGRIGAAYAFVLSIRPDS